MKVSEKLKHALEIFGPNGETWSRGVTVEEFHTVVPAGKYCALTACSAVEPNFLLRNSMLSRLARQVPGPYGNIIEFNDEHEFADVKALFERAIASAEAEGQ